MKATLALLLIAGPAAACDWVKTETVDSMTDARVCEITSADAKLSLFVRGGNISFATGSAYRRDGLSVRIDDNKSIVFGRSRSTLSSFPPDSEPGRQAIAEIRQGQRLRVSYSDYPSPIEGDAPICNLPELLDSCLTQP